MRIDLTRLNHVLIPQTNEQRERFRRGRIGRLTAPLANVAWGGALTDEGRTIVLVTILVGAFGLDVQSTTAYVFFAVLTGLVAGSLVGVRHMRLDDVTVSIDAPRRVTVGEPATFSIICARGAASNAKDAEASHAVRVHGPFLPWDGRWVDPPPPELRIPAGETREATMRARFVARGLRHLDPFTAAAVMPLGLTCGPRRETDAVKIHVVPRIAEISRLPSTARARHQPGGVALASKSGEARDLLGLRPYRPGDPVRDLHARSWARTGIPVVREYQQEYFTRVGVVLDTGIEDPDRLERAIELAAGVIAYLSRGEALVDVLVVGDKVHELTLGRSLGYIDQALELLALVGRGPTVATADMLRRVEPYLDRLSSIFVIAVPDGGGTSRAPALARAIEARGVHAATLLVDDDVARAMAAGEALSW